MRSQPLPAAYAVTSTSRHTAVFKHAAASRLPVYHRSVRRCRSTVKEYAAVPCRAIRRCRSTVNEYVAVRCRGAVSCRAIRRCRATVNEYAAVRCRFVRSATVYRYLPTHHTARVDPPSSLVQSTKQIRFILTLLNRTMRHVNCWTDGTGDCDMPGQGETRDRRRPGTKDAQRRAGSTRLFCRFQGRQLGEERCTREEGKNQITTTPWGWWSAVQRTGCRTHPSDDKPDALQEWSRVAEKRQNEQQEDTKRRQCHRIRQGRIPAASAQLSSAKAGHRSRSPNEGETGDASANLDATHQVGRGLESEVLTLRSSAKAECSYQGVDNGGGGIWRVNMIRVHRRQEEPKEPKFGESRAAPLQGADSGRPSGSSQVRGMGQERRMGPGGAHLNDDYGSSMFTQNQESQEVPYSVTSSERRYDRTGQNKDARPKSSTGNSIILIT